jgi:hypothetical protein
VSGPLGRGARRRGRPPWRVLGRRWDSSVRLPASEVGPLQGVCGVALVEVCNMSSFCVRVNLCRVGG